MTWYAAHIVMLVRFKQGVQRRFPAWENIVLVQAQDENEALSKAESLGQRGAGDDGGSFKWDGKLATWEFAGVRKVTECALLGARLFTDGRAPIVVVSGASPGVWKTISRWSWRTI